MYSKRLALVLVLACGLIGTSNAAQLVVVSSNVPALQVGALIDGTRAITLAQGRFVTLISSQGKILKLRGPYSGRPDPSPAAKGGDLLRSLSQIVSGPPESDPSLAVFRSAPGSNRRDVWSIDVSRSGIYCVTNRLPLKLWRSKVASESQLTLTRPGPQRYTITKVWPQGQQTLLWPKELPLTNDTTYLVRLQGRPNWTRLEIALLPTGLHTDAHRAAWMWKNDCARQARQLLEDIVKRDQ